MAWQGILGHDGVVEQFRRAISRNRLASSFLFLGPAGIGKRTFAVELAQSLLCERHDADELESCGECPSCAQVAALSHPDLSIVEKPKDKNFIPVELFIGDRDHRMREGLCHDISLKPSGGRRKFAIIDDADFLNQEGANCLLKTLEEPPAGSMLILIGTSEQKQLPTIRSRCQIIRFQPLSDEAISELVLEHGIADSRQQADRLAADSQGSLETARQLADPELCEFRERLYGFLSQPNGDTVRFAKSLNAFVDEAGKDAPARRLRMIHIIQFAVGFYRQLISELCRVSATSGDQSASLATKQAVETWPGDEETAADCLQICLEALTQVAANANQATLLECWLDDLDLARK